MKSEQVGTFTPVKVKPIFSWVGGKRRMMDFIRENIPQDFTNYHEPFLGGGAVAIDLLAHTPPAVEGEYQRTFYLSDLNSEVVVTWEVVRNNLEELIDTFHEHMDRHDRAYFKAVRSWDKDGLLPFKSPVERASRFLYILYSAFNCQWQEDSDGFCVSGFGYDRVRIPHYFFDNLRTVSSLLNTHDVRIKHQSFEDGIGDVQAADFVYLDPPYATDDLNGSETWDSYLAGGAGDEFQPKVRKYIDQLTEIGVYALASNADTQTTHALYSGWNQIEKHITWAGGGVAGRLATEKLFANFLLYVALGYAHERDIDDE